MAERTSSWSSKAPPLDGGSAEMGASMDERTQKTDLVEAGITTRPIATAGLEAILEQVVARIQEELASAEKGSEAAQEAHLHLAILAVDFLQGFSHAEKAGANSLSLAIMLAYSTRIGEVDDFEKCVPKIEKVAGAISKEALGAVRLRLAEQWLYRFSFPEKAMPLAVKAATAGIEGAAELHELTLGLLGRWADLAAVLSKGETADLVRSAQILSDRQGEQTMARKRLEPCAEGAGLYGTFLHDQLGILSGAKPQDMALRIRLRLKVLAEQSPDSPEVLAWNFLLAECLASAGEDEEALALFSDLTTKAGWSTSVAQLSTMRLAQRSAQWQMVVEQLGKQAALSKDVGLRNSYLRRCAEVFECHLDQIDQAQSTWRTVWDNERGNPEAYRNLVRLLHDNQDALFAYFQEVAESSPSVAVSSLRQAGVLAHSRLDDGAKVLEKCAEISGSLHDFLELSRVQIDREKPHTAAGVYRQASTTADGRSSAGTLLFASALWELVAGREQEAMVALAESSRRSPKAVFAWQFAALLHHGAGNSEELKEALKHIVELSQSDKARFDALVELGVLCRDSKDYDGAQDALRRASELQPNDAVLLLALAELHEVKEDWASAISLREKATKHLSEENRAAEVWFDIANLELSRRNDPEAAIAALEKARSIDGANVAVIHKSQELYRRVKRPADEMSMYALELELVEDPARRLALCLECARVAESAGQSRASAFDYFVLAAEIEPNNAIALRGVSELGMELKKFDQVLATYQEATESAQVLEVLCKAHRAKEDWAAVIAVSQRLIAATSDASAKLAIAKDVAEIADTRIKSKDDAVEAFRLVLSIDGKERSAQKRLRTLLESEGRWKELVVAIEDEVVSHGTGEKDLQRELRLQQGQVYREQLGDDAAAITSFEKVLELDGENLEAARALQELYTASNQSKKLLGIKEILAKEEGSAEILKEIAALRVETGDVDGALQAYLSAQKNDPADRELFSEIEKLCYSKRRWPEVMSLYNLVIASVEKGDNRAYRLGDLYARRGQIQIQYLDQRDAACESFLRVLEEDPGHLAAMSSLEETYRDNQDWKSLIAAYQTRARSSDEQAIKVESLQKAADVAVKRLKNQKQAEEILRSLVSLCPDDTSAFERLEQMYTESEDWHNLVELYEEQLAYQDKKGSPELTLLKKLARACEEGLRDGKRAVRYYERLIDLTPQNRRALDALARIFESTEQWTQFVDATRRLIKVTKDRNVKALLYFKCGSVTEAKFGNEEDAIRYYDAAIKTAPSCLPAVHGLRDLYLRRKDWPRVIQTLELEVKLWQDEKERAGVFAQIGRIYGEELAQQDRALHYYECALAVDPDCVPANRALFERYFEAQEWERAEPMAAAIASKAMRDSDPMRRSEFYRMRGIVMQHMNDPVGAAESIIISLEIQPQNLLALEALVELGAIAPNAYDFPNTFRELEKIYKKRPGSNEFLARVLVGRSRIATQSGDLHTATELLNEAIDRSPDDYTIVLALVDLHESVRNWGAAAEVLDEYAAEAEPEWQIHAYLRKAQLFSEGALDGKKAEEILRALLEIAPDEPEVHYQLSQELYCQNRLPEARKAIERVIELVATPESDVSAQRLARYYYYLGRILERGNDVRTAVSQYRRAADYDPGYAPPALALAMRSMNNGDQPAAESRLINSAHAAMAQGERSSAIPLQRGLARILLKGGDREAAIEAYRGILEVDPAGAADRLALAEIYAEGDIQTATEEVRTLLENGLRHGPAYRVLAGYYMQAAQPVRATRVLTAMGLLGYAEDQDVQMLRSAQAICPKDPLQGSLGAEVRGRHLATEACNSPVAEFFRAAFRPMSELLCRQSLGEELIPLPEVNHSGLHAALRYTSGLFGIEPEVYVGKQVPGRVAVLAHPRQIVVLDEELLKLGDTSLQFTLGWALDAIRDGYSPLLRLGERQRHELAQLLRSLFSADPNLQAQGRSFRQTLPPEATSILDREAGRVEDLSMEEWIDGMNATARRAGLLASDDLAIAAKTLAAFEGESTSEDHSGMGTVFCGEDLFQFLVSDEYDYLRLALAGSQPVSRG